MNFIKKVFLGEIDDFVHRQFIRFGKGRYERRALLRLWKTKKIKIKSSFEFANDFVLFIAGLGDFKFSGIVLSKNEISIHSSDGGTKKQGLFFYNVENISSREVNELADKIYYFLLDVSDLEIGLNLKIKNKLPKPGKGEYKIDDKFCQLELDEKYYGNAKNDFFWDLPDCKKAQVEHVFLIDEIILPQDKEEKDFAKIREMAIRKGKIIRISNVEGKEVKTEKEFEA